MEAARTEAAAPSVRYEKYRPPQLGTSGHAQPSTPHLPDLARTLSNQGGSISGDGGHGSRAWQSEGPGGLARPLLSEEEQGDSLTDGLITDIYDRSFLEGFLSPRLRPLWRQRSLLRRRTYHFDEAVASPSGGSRNTLQGSASSSVPRPVSRGSRAEGEGRSAAAGPKDMIPTPPTGTAPRHPRPNYRAGAAIKTSLKVNGEAQDRSAAKLNSMASEYSTNAVGKQGQMQRQREACESIRILMFGLIGNEDWPSTEKARIFEQRRGTSRELQCFAEKWSQLDKNVNGEVDLSEFLEYFNRRNTDKLLGMRCVRYLLGLDKGGGDQDAEVKSAVAGRKKGCSREDMMRLVWLQASDADVEEMCNMFDMYKLRMACVPPLPLLAERKRRELEENFVNMRAGSGTVVYRDMVESGIVDEDTAQELRAGYDKDGSGEIDFDKFCEIFCPFGYLAHERADVAVDKQGQVMKKATCQLGESRFEGWLMENDLQALQKQYSNLVA